MSDENELERLTKQARELGKLAQGKLQWVAEQISIDPFMLIGLQQKLIIDWFLPERGDDGDTNLERVKFDIFCNEQMIEFLDTLVSNSTRSLHIIKGVKGNGADKPD